MNIQKANELIKEEGSTFDIDALVVWCDNFHIETPTAEELKEAEESYAGDFYNASALAEHLVDETGMLNAIPTTVANYFDYEKYGRDLILGGDFWNEGRHFFRSI